MTVDPLVAFLVGLQIGQWFVWWRIWIWLWRSGRFDRLYVVDRAS
jgi:hypothetical protein